MMTLLLATLLVGQTPGPVAVEVLPFDPAALRAMAPVEIQVDEGGKGVKYSGVPLATLLKPKDRAEVPMAGLRALSDAVLLVRAADGYQVAVSATAVAMDPKGERYLLALARDGKPLDPGSGPVRLIVPGDAKHARWVKSVAAVRLVRLDKLVTEP